MLDQHQTDQPFAPPARSTILRPGLRALPPGFERHVVNGGGTILVDIEPGDAIVLTDIDFDFGGRSSG
jgi:hypothetical protein